MAEHTAIFRASASPEIGGGHIIRCLSLARELRDQGWNCIFASEQETLMMMPIIREFKFLKLSKNDEKDEASQVRKKLNSSAAAVIVDHYNRGLTFEKKCRKWSKIVMAIDDIPNRLHDVDLLLDQTGGRTPHRYKSLVPKDCKILTGPKFSLLRSSFSSLGASHKRHLNRGKHRIFVAMGASDPKNLTNIVLNTIHQVSPNSSADILLSSNAPHLSGIKKLCSGHHTYSLHTDLNDPASLISKATFAVGTAGINLWERCALGVPSVIVIAAENQRANAEYVIQNNGGIFGGALPTLDQNYLRQAISRMANEDQIVLSCSQGAAKICDGLGTKRVAKIIFSLVKNSA